MPISKGQGSAVDSKWAVEALKELLDDHGRFPEEVAMTPERFDEIRGVVYQDPKLLPGPPPKGAPGQLSVGEIIHRCNDAAQKMGRTNLHAYLLLTCADALNQLVRRLDRFENPAAGGH